MLYMTELQNNNLMRVIKQLSISGWQQLNRYQDSINSISLKVDNKKKSFNYFDRRSMDNRYNELFRYLPPYSLAINNNQSQSKRGRIKMTAISQQIKSSSMDRRHLSQNKKQVASKISMLTLSQQIITDVPVKQKPSNDIYLKRTQRNIEDKKIKTEGDHLEERNIKKRVFYLSGNRSPFTKQDSQAQSIYRLPNFDICNQPLTEKHKSNSTMNYLKQCISKLKKGNKSTDIASGQYSFNVDQNIKKSVIQPFPQPNPLKYKRKSHSKEQNIFNKVYDYVLTKRMRTQIQKSLVIQSKKQQLIKKNAQRFKIQSNIKKAIKKVKQRHTFSVEKTREEQQKIIEQKNSLKNKIIIKKTELINKREMKSLVKNKNFIDFINQKQNLTIYDHKIITYRQLIFLVNLAHRTIKDVNMIDLLSLSKQEKNTVSKYAFYVGPGNNCKLIRAIMRRRPWWFECGDVKDADFVWTQIKIKNIFEIQDDSKHKIDDNIKSSRSEKILLSQSSIKIENPPSNFEQKSITKLEKLTQSQVIIPSNRGLLKEYVFKPPFQHSYVAKILLPDQQNKYNHMMSSLSANQFDNFEARAKYYPENFLLNYDYKKLIHNHLEFNQSLGNKKALFYHMKLYYKIRGIPLCEALPLTFHIKSLKNDLQFDEFLQQYTKKSKNKSLKNIWMVKPGQNSNRGSGIDLFSDIRRLRYYIKQQKYKNGEDKTYIIQKYIQRPLLYHGRKFDIRHYLLVTTLYGQMRAYWFGQGYIRTSSFAFSLSQIEDSMIHLTNDAIQKNSKQYGIHQEGNKISYNQLQRYFDKYFPSRRFDFKKIYSKMRSLAKDAISSAYFSLSLSKKVNNFQIFGLDFMIDDFFKVYLIEINTNPCLQISSNLLGRIIPTMVQQSFRMSLDAIFPPNIHYNNNEKSIAPDCSLEKFQMELIFDEVRDKSQLQNLYKDYRQQYKEVIRNLVGSDEDEQTYENEGEDVQIDKLIL